MSKGAPEKKRSVRLFLVCTSAATLEWTNQGPQEDLPAA
jgi:hypothetical protein